VAINEQKVLYCGSEMEMKITSIDSGWGEYKLIVEGVNAHMCPECGEVVLEGKEAIMLQNLSKSLANMEEGQRPEVINLDEVSNLIKVP